MNRLDAMSILVAVVDAGSLSAAARRLDMPLPTVSRKVGELESHLKTRLLHRTTRNISLTEAGASYVAACRRILDEIGEAERAATGEYAAPRGELVVTASVTFGNLHVVPVVADFLAAYPQIDIDLVLTDRVVHLMDERADVAIRIGALPDSTFVAKQVGTVRRIVCASPAYLDAHGVPNKPADLSGHQCITFEALESTRSWVFGSGKSELSIPVQSRLTVNTADAAITAAILGVGLIRVLSYQVADAIRANELRVVLEEFESQALPVHVVHAGQFPLPLKLRAFVDFVTPRLHTRIAGAPRNAATQPEPIRHALDAHWQASAAGDLEAEHDIYADDAVCDYPQSGERIVGRRNLQSLRAHHPDKPSGFAVRRMQGAGNLWVTEYSIAYQERSAFTVSIMEFREGKVVHETQYFSDPFAAPAWRSQWVQKIT